MTPHRTLLTLGLASALLLHPAAEATCRRSRAVARTFQRQTGYPHGRPGYVIDHILPLACGGPDATTNLQWQTVAAATAKDRWERLHCKGCQ